MGRNGQKALERIWRIGTSEFHFHIFSWIFMHFHAFSFSGSRMGPALTDRTGIAKNLSHTCIGKQHWDVCAWRRESGQNWAQKQPKYTCPWQLNLHIHTSGKWVFDYKRQDGREGIDFGHQGGATCKFSGQFTVELVRTKNRTFHHRNLTKSIVLTHVKW